MTTQKCTYRYITFATKYTKMKKTHAYIYIPESRANPVSQRAEHVEMVIIYNGVYHPTDPSTLKYPSVMFRKGDGFR